MNIKVLYEPGETHIEIYHDDWFKDLIQLVEPDEDTEDWTDKDVELA